MLTQRDLDEIEELIGKKLEEKFNEKLGLIPTKNEFFKAMDQIMGQLKKMQETYELAEPKISDHETRITSLEDLHPQGKHAFT